MREISKPTIPFGQHKGEELDDVPAEYLLWLSEQDWVEEKFPEIANYIQREKEALKNEAKMDREHLSQRRDEGFDEY